MVSVYDFSNYRDFIRAWLIHSGQRGLQGRLAAAMNISSSMMSLVLQGEKNLTPDQAIEGSEFLQLNERETDFFLLLLDHAHAVNHKLQKRLEKKISDFQHQAKKISNRVKRDMEISEEAKAIYYSSWLYTGVRNITALPNMSAAAQIAERLGVPLARVIKVLDFLLEQGLCIKNENGYTYGPAHLHAGVDSPHANRHHQNWRQRSIQHMDLKRDGDLFYTCPLSLSAADADWLRDELLKTIDSVLKRVGPSASEVVRCLNIDYFEY